MADENQTVEEDEEGVLEGVEMQAHEQEGSIIRGWPALLITLAMFAAGIYSFAPRPDPVFPPTEIQPNQLMTNSIDKQGKRYIAAGELGKILIADNPKGPWRVAKVEPQRGATLTAIRFVDKDVAIAVGHSGWIVRSEDAGETWRELQFNEESSDPLLGIGGPFKGVAKGKLFAFGSFGQYLTSSDGGKSWNKEELNIVEPEPEPEPEAEVAEGEDAATEVADAAEDAADDAEEFDPFAGGDDEEDEDYDPFADFMAGGGAADVGNKHMYAMTQAADGSLYLVGEKGLAVRSTDAGASWVSGEEFYNGSLYGALSLGRHGMLVYGMRGNAFVTTDNGQTWTQSDIPLEQGLYGGAKSYGGTVVLVGASNTILISKDNGLTFTKASRRGPFGLVAIMPLDSGSWLMAGEGGLSVRSINLLGLLKALVGSWS